jgi:hypothetical protein
VCAAALAGVAASSGAAPAPAGGVWFLTRPGPRGGVTEVALDADGVLASRTVAGGSAVGEGAPARWRPPDGDAVALGGAWWALDRRVDPVPVRRPSPESLAALGVDVVDAVIGDPDGDGADEAVVLFRRPHRSTVVNDLYPDRVLVDARGRSLHLGVYRPADMAQEWVAGTVFAPVAAVAACDGALALAYSSTVDLADRVAVGVTPWGGFGFVSLPALPDLPGAGVPACADVDGDGSTDPLVLSRRTVTVSGGAVAERRQQW